MNKPHKHAKCIKAWADGAEIEYRYGEGHEWRSADCLQWGLYTEYRITPQPVIVKKYTYFDRIERTLEHNMDLNAMRSQTWYTDEDDMCQPYLEWTFTDNKLTSVTIIGG